MTHPPRGLGPSQRRTHKCPAPPCDAQVPQHKLACRGHWFALPQALRDEIWNTYNKPGQGHAHAVAVKAAVDWLEERYPAGE